MATPLLERALPFLATATLLELLVELGACSIAAAAPPVVHALLLDHYVAICGALAKHGCRLGWSASGPHQAFFCGGSAAEVKDVAVLRGIARACVRGLRAAGGPTPRPAATGDASELLRRAGAAACAPGDDDEEEEDAALAGLMGGAAAVAAAAAAPHAGGPAGASATGASTELLELDLLGVASSFTSLVCRHLKRLLPPVAEEAAAVEPTGAAAAAAAAAFTAPATSVTAGGGGTSAAAHGYLDRLRLVHTACDSGADFMIPFEVSWMTDGAADTICMPDFGAIAASPPHRAYYLRRHARVAEAAAAAAAAEPSSPTHDGRAAAAGGGGGGCVPATTAVAAADGDDGFGLELLTAVGDAFLVPAHEVIHIVQHHRQQRDTSGASMAAEHDASTVPALLTLRVLLDADADGSLPRGLASLLCAQLVLKCTRLARNLVRGGGAAAAGGMPAPHVDDAAAAGAPGAAAGGGAGDGVAAASAPSAYRTYRSWFNAFGVSNPRRDMLAAAAQSLPPSDAVASADADAREAAVLQKSVQLENAYKWLACLDTAVAYRDQVPMLGLLQLPESVPWHASAARTPVADPGAALLACGCPVGGCSASSSTPAEQLDDLLRALLCVTFRGRSGDVMDAGAAARVHAAAAAHRLPVVA